MNDIHDPAQLVETRVTTHGDIVEQAKFYEAVMKAARATPNWQNMPIALRLILEYVFKKVARILCGDYLFIDHWADIGGYIHLAIQTIFRMRDITRPYVAWPVEPNGPGTPEDGGHHARQEDDDAAR
jgi:hypothetical protein